MNPAKFVLLDRDGVINQDSDDFIKSAEEWQPIPGSLEAIALLNKHGYKVIVTTNQSGIGRGFYTERDYELVTAAMQAELRVDLDGIGRTDHAYERYQILGELGEGPLSLVYRGRDNDIGREVALKVLREEHLGEPETVQRFIEEAQISGQLQHPGILPVYELGLREDERPYFATRIVKGETLAFFEHYALLLLGMEDMIQKQLVKGAGSE